MKDNSTLSFLGKELLGEFDRFGRIEEIGQGEEILREGQYVKVLPIVLSGLVKVYSTFNERELLLYYIRPDESCVMSFTAGLNNQASKVFAVTESPAQLLLLPVARLQDWVKKYPQFNQLFLTQYNQRYSELIETMNHVLFEKMDKRILDYLKEKTVVTGKNSVKMTHREIATDLGTAREVVSRMLKKLESEQRIEVLDGVIKML